MEETPPSGRVVTAVPATWRDAVARRVAEGRRIVALLTIIDDPIPTGSVFISVAVGVGIDVAVDVGISVGVSVAVAIDVCVDVAIRVDVGIGGSIRSRI